MIYQPKNIKDMILRPLIAGFLGLTIGGAFTVLTGNSPFTALKVLLSTGFGCSSANNCAILTTLQYATPLILLGLSAAVAFRAGFFSIGQAGQMLLGAAAANWVANTAINSAWLHAPLALTLAGLIAMGYAMIPAALKLYLNINEIISTFLLNSIAVYLVGFIPSGYGRQIPTSAQLHTLVPGTKLNTGLFIALGLLFITSILMWRTATGYEIRMSGQNQLFAISGGIKSHRSIFLAIMISGTLAGLASGIEVLGVHYHFVQNFTGSDLFDGVMVALIGFCHPVGILFSSFLLGGVRLAAMTGLSIQMGIPRSIGGMMISVMVIVMGADGIYDWLKLILRKIIGKINPINT